LDVCEEAHSVVCPEALLQVGGDAYITLGGDGIVVGKNGLPPDALERRVGAPIGIEPTTS